MNIRKGTRTARRSLIGAFLLVNLSQLILLITNSNMVLASAPDPANIPSRFYEFAPYIGRVGYCGNGYVPPEKMVENYDSQLKANANSTESYLGRADSLLELHKFQQAKSDCVRALQLHPGDAKAYQLLAICEALEGNYDESLNWYSNLLAEQPHSSSIYRYRGNVRYLNKDYQGAVDEYTKALAVDPLRDTTKCGVDFFYHDGTYELRGDACCRLGDYGGAQDDYKRALKEGAPASIIYSEIVLCQAAAQEQKKGNPLSLVSSDGSAEAFKHNAIVHAMQGRSDLAHKEYNEGHNVDLGNIDIMSQRAAIELMAGEPELASVDCDHVLFAEPNNVNATILLAVSEDERGKRLEAVTHYERALHLGGDDSVIRTLNINQYKYDAQRVGDPVLIEKYTSEALKLDPNDMQLYAIRSNARFLLKDFDGANADAQRQEELRAARKK